MENTKIEWAKRRSHHVWLKMDVRSWFWNAVIYLPLVILLQAAGWHYPAARWFAGGALGIWIGGFGHNLLWAWLESRRSVGANINHEPRRH